MSNIKIGFIGCGKHARANIYPSLRLVGEQIACVAARHLDHAQAVANEYQIPKVYDNYQAMLTKERPNAVFVITGGDQHAKIVEDCLSSGSHVFVEKPLGLNQVEARKIAEVSRRTKKIVMVGFMKRFAPSYLTIKQISEKKDVFGNILSMTSMFAIGARGKGDEMYLRSTAIHYIDLIRFLLGEVVELSAVKNSKDEHIDQLLTFVCSNGRIGTMFLAGLPAWERHYEEITITGINGFVKAENLRKVIFHQHAINKTAIPRWQFMDEHDHTLVPVSTSSSGGWQDLYLGGFVGEVQSFINCILNSTQPSCSADDNVKTTALCDRIVESFHQIKIT